ncbi:MAG: hypothetical protein MH204_11450 [Fimbriimonadaceae bacterium]|nr:hypothetical protein [Fimbriimonadaceae bacterium]
MKVADRAWPLLCTGSILLAGCLPATVTSADPPPTAAPAQIEAAGPLFLDGFFIIGVFSQPVESFGKWKARGINTILEVPQNHDPAAWDRAAQAAGLRIIRRPLANPRADIGRRDLLAWSHWDEPDAAGRIFEWTPLFERTAREWRGIDPNRKIFINFAGPDISWFTQQQDSYSRNYASHYPRLLATADWVANDLYPSGGYLNRAHAPRRGDITLIGEPIRILRQMTDKPQFAFIEASEIEQGNVAGARAPTPPEMRAQIWYAVTLGVRGLFYFPAVVGTRGFSFDGATPDLVAEMTRQNALLSRLGPILQSEVDPKSIQVQAPAPLAVGWRRGRDADLVIVVNTRGQAVRGAAISVRGVRGSQATDLATNRTLPIQNGTITENLDPHGVRLYLVAR